ncbi:radical SAM protein [Streptococcus marmotae]
MQILSPYILRKKTETGELFFNSKNNHSCFITNDLLDAVENDLVVKGQYENYLSKYNYFQEENEFEKTIEYVRNTEMETLEFTILTHGDCNFRCKYCYEKFENIKMSEETEAAIVEFTEKLLAESMFKYMHVSWFGGEPLLGLKTIKNLSEKFMTICSQNGLDYSASITTNGYLLNERIIHQLILGYSVSSFQITLDGDEESHNFQRVLHNGKGSYSKILENIRCLQNSNLNFCCNLRFNISKENFNNVKIFLESDGESFKHDKRFRFYFYNVGSWGCGERSRNYKVTLPDPDASFELSKFAIKKGYNVPAARGIITNLFNCYANRKNHYTFNVKGVIQTCTIALYSNSNIFGSVHGKFNHEKFDRWYLTIDSECQKCPNALICKSGFCPPKHRSNKQRTLCNQVKKKIDKNLELFILNKEYCDYLDVKREEV